MARIAFTTNAGFVKRDTHGREYVEVARVTEDAPGYEVWETRPTLEQAEDLVVALNLMQGHNAADVLAICNSSMAASIEQGRVK